MIRSRKKCAQEPGFGRRLACGDCGFRRRRSTVLAHSALCRRLISAGWTLSELGLSVDDGVQGHWLELTTRFGIEVDKTDWKLFFKHPLKILNGFVLPLGEIVERRIKGLAIRGCRRGYHRIVLRLFESRRAPG